LKLSEALNTPTTATTTTTTTTSNYRMRLQWQSKHTSKYIIIAMAFRRNCKPVLVEIELPPEKEKKQIGQALTKV